MCIRDRLYSESKQLMVDVVLVRQERVLPVAYPMQVDPDPVSYTHLHGCEEFSPRPWEDLVTAVTNQQNRGFEESVTSL